MKPTKAELRQRLRRTRLEMAEGERTLKSQPIVKRLLAATDWSAVKTLHFFEPIHQLLEVDIRDFITYLEDDYPDIRLFTSRLIGDTWQLVSIHGAPAAEVFDVVIVPSLGFDERLNRVGYGGGYYDRFLATQPTAKKLGVCFEAGKVDLVPAEPHDIPMDMIITESNTYS